MPYFSFLFALADEILSTSDVSVFIHKDHSHKIGSIIEVNNLCGIDGLRLFCQIHDENMCGVADKKAITDNSCNITLNI